MSLYKKGWRADRGWAFVGTEEPASLQMSRSRESQGPFRRNERRRREEAKAVFIFFPRFVLSMSHRNKKRKWEGEDNLTRVKFS